MPCDTVTTSSVGGLERADRELVRAALASLTRRQNGTAAYLGTAEVIDDGAGLAVRVGRSSVTWAPGVGLTVTSPTADRLRSAVVQAYSRQAVEVAAKRNGWKLGAWAGNKVEVTR